MGMLGEASELLGKARDRSPNHPWMEHNESALDDYRFLVERGIGNDNWERDCKHETREWCKEILHRVQPKPRVASAAELMDRLPQHIQL